MYRTLERILHLPRRVAREAVGLAQLLLLSLINRYGTSPVSQPGGPVVSLTTYGRRARTVYLTIESIARGEVLPSRLILWIDEIGLFNGLPNTIHRLQRRGLEVRLCGSYGPHKKYYPYVESQDSFDQPLVTADDDVLYPKYWLKRLVAANQKHPEAINCYRAFVADVSGEGLAPYRNWIQGGVTRPSFRNFAIGSMGVIYPPRFLMALKQAGTGFEDSCPKADDLWLHVQAIRSGYKVRQILPRLPYFSFHEVPGTQGTNLRYENVDYGDGNDRQIATTYTQSDFELLRADCSATPGHSVPGLPALGVLDL